MHRLAFSSSILMLATSGCILLDKYDYSSYGDSSSSNSSSSSVSSSISTGGVGGGGAGTGGVGGTGGMGGNGGMGGSDPCAPDLCDDGMGTNCAATDCSVKSEQTFLMGSVEHQAIKAMVAPGNGQIVIGGNYAGSINFGGSVGTFTGSTTIRPFIAKLDADGTGIAAYQRTEKGVISSVDADPMGDALYGAGNIISSGNIVKVFVQRFGSTPWEQLIGNSTQNDAGGVARGGTGHVFAAGQFAGDVTSPDCPGFVNYTTSTVDSLLMQLSETDGACTWITKLSHAYARSTAANATRVVVAGFYSGTITEINSPPTTDTGSFFAVYDTESHAILRKNFLVPVNGSTVNLRQVALDPMDKESVYITARLQGKLNVSMNSTAKTLQSTPEESFGDLIVAKYNPSGELVWINRFGGFGEQEPNSITIYNGSIFISGTTNQNMSLVPDTDSGPLCDTTKCMFLLKLDPATGMPIWGRAFGGGELASDATAISTADGANFWLGGGWSTPIDFGNGLKKPLSPGQDLVLAKFTGLP